VDQCTVALLDYVNLSNNCVYQLYSRTLLDLFMREGFLVNFTSMNDAMAQQQGQAICKDAATCKAICENSFSPFANKLFE
jgi:hypothetical protein